MAHSSSLVALVAGLILTTLVMRVPTLPMGIWIALPCLLYAARTLPGAAWLSVMAVGMYGAVTISQRGILPMPDPLYYGVTASLTAFAIAPFLVDRFLPPRFSGWHSTLIFPMAWVAMEFARARITPGATWGASAYTQYGNAALMQLASVTGVWGISFLIAWFASVVNWSLAQGVAAPAVRPAVLGYAGVLGLVLVGGALRLALTPSSGGVLRAAVVSVPREMFQPGEVTAIIEGRYDDSAREFICGKLRQLQDWFLDNSRREARSGARIIAWPETSLLVLATDEPAFLERARRLAADEHVYLSIGICTLHPGVWHSFENKVVLIDPDGAIRFSYHKSRPVPGWEESIIVRGDGQLPIAATEDGRIGASICFEGDFPEFVRLIRREQADLWVLPVNDWPGIKDTHLEMAAFRAVENGTPLLRAANVGISAAFDQFGRLLARTDHFTGARSMVAQLPIGHVPTIYTHIGDLFAWLCVAGLAVGAMLAFSGRAG